MKRSRQISLALVAIVISLSIAEGVVRQCNFASTRPEMAQPEAGRAYAAAAMLLPIERDGLTYGGRPGASVTIRDVEYRHNELGLRGPPVTLPKPQGRQRILLLGDSNSYGWGVPYDDTFAARITRAFGRENGSATVDVVNGSIPGYNSGDELALLRKLAPKVEPDLVVLIWFANDLQRLSFHVDLDGYLFCDPLPIFDAWKPRLWASRFYRLLSAARFKAMKDSGEYKPIAPQTEAWCEKRINAIADYAEEIGVPLVVVDLPVLEPDPAGGHLLTRDGYYGSKLSGWLRRVCLERNLELFDLVDSIDGEIAARLWVSIELGDHHPNGVGHAKFAAALIPFLRARGFGE